MELYMSMIAYWLNKKYKIDEKHQKINDRHPLKMPLFLSDDVNISDEYLYVATSDVLLNTAIDIKTISILCIGLPDKRTVRRSGELLTIETDTTDDTSINILNELFMIFNRYAAWEQKLSEITHTTQNIKALLENSEDILGNPCILIDDNFSIMGYSKNFFNRDVFAGKGTPTDVPLDDVNNYRMDDDFIKLRKKRGVFRYTEQKEFGELLCINLTYRRKYFARLIMHDYNHSITAADERNIERLAYYIQTIFDRKEESLMFSDRTENLHTLVTSLAVEGHPVSSSDLTRILEGTDWQITDRYQAIYLRLITSPLVENNVTYLSGKIEQIWNGSCAVPTDTGILWLLNRTIYDQSNDYAFYDTLAIFLRESLCQAGISNIFTDLQSCAMYFDQAKEALQLGSRKMPTHWYHYFKDYTLDYILEESTRTFPARELCDERIIYLIEYDKMHQTDFFETLKIYLYSKFNVTEAAEKLYIHRTTLVSRLKKIHSLVHLDLDDIKTVQLLYVSFALLE